MPAPLCVNKAAVRRFLLRRQLLNGRTRSGAANPDDILETIRALECVQLDPVAAVERNQHLVLAARLRRYQPAALERLLEAGRVFEYWANAACVIPMEDYPLFEVVRQHFTRQLHARLDPLRQVADDVLKRLEAEGPLPSKAFQSAERVHGYWDNTNAKTKATSHALNLLNDMGRIMVVRREGTTRFFDLRERAVPADLLHQARTITEQESRHALFDKYMRAYRVFDVGDPRFGWQRTTAAERRRIVEERVRQGAVIPLEIEDGRKTYFVLAEDADEIMEMAAFAKDSWSAGTAYVRFLPPLDNLLWRRERIEDLFAFSYTWEVYTPASKRRHGYYAMPILAGDRLIGRIDPRLDRHNARLDIRLLQIDPGVRWSKTLRNHVFDALAEFARFHHAQIGLISRTDPADLPV